MEYCVSKGGTFGRVSRRYFSEDGKELVLIAWGPKGWLTPVFYADVHFCSSHYESEARKEAEEWLDKQEKYEGTTEPTMTEKRGCPWCGYLGIKLEEDKKYRLSQAYCTSCGARGPEDWDKDRAMELFVGVEWKEKSNEQ